MGHDGRLGPHPNEGSFCSFLPRPHGLEAESARERQAVALADLDARTEPLPTIIAGDFNATPEAASIRYLTGLQSIGGRSVHYHDAGPWVEMDLVTPGI